MSPRWPVGLKRELGALGDHPDLLGRRDDPLGVNQQHRPGLTARLELPVVIHHLQQILEYQLVNQLNQLLDLMDQQNAVECFDHLTMNLKFQELV